jgi:hypothetical protein
MTNRNPPIEGDDEVIWGAVEIAAIINRTPRQTYNLLESGQLPAKRIGGRWAATKGNLRRLFSEVA